MVEKEKLPENPEDVILHEMREAFFYIGDWKEYLTESYPEKLPIIEGEIKKHQEALVALKNENLHATDILQIQNELYNFKVRVHDELEQFSRDLTSATSVDHTINNTVAPTELDEQPVPSLVMEPEVINATHSLPEGFEDDIVDANDFFELYEAIRKQKEIPYSQGILNSDELILIIDAYRDGDDNRLINIPRVAHLREAVSDLTHRERVSEKIRQADSLPTLYDAVRYIQSIDENGEIFEAADIISNIDRYHDLRDENILFNIPKTGGIRDKARDIVLRQIIDENAHPIRTMWRKVKTWFD